MSIHPTQGDGKITVPALLQRKSDPASQKIVCLTAYDYPTSRLADQAGVVTSFSQSLRNHRVGARVVTTR